VTRRLVPVLVALVALAAAAAARADKIAFTAADQKTAHAIVLQKADLGTGWKGGAKKPDLSGSSIGCAGLKVNEPAIVATGAAETDFANGPVDVDSEAEVTQAPDMVAADFRFATQPGIVDCLRKVAPKQFGAKATVVSISRASLPHLTAHAGGFRVVVDVPTNGTKVRIDVDVLFVGKGRTELTLTMVAPDAVRTTLRASELKLLRLLASRTPAS
jgi:hypothetical protein